MTREGNPPPALELRQVAFAYPRERPVFAGLSVRFGSGTSTSIQGRSGSGKSTLISVLGLLRSPSEGALLVDGRDVAALSDRSRSRLRGSHIGFVFQDSHLAPGQPVWKSVALPVLLGGCDRRVARDRAYEALERLELSGLERRRPDQLSGGQRQRCAVARAIAVQPRVVIADEPTGSLDEETADVVAAALLDLARHAGVAVIVVTHDDAVARLAERRLTLAQGSLA